MLIENVRMLIKKNNMLCENETAVVGFSGGADSTALLLALHELSNELKISVKAVHINHQLRGEESDRDENFCRFVCEKYGIPFSCHHINVNEYAIENHKSIEESARILRYQIFDKECQNLCGGKICTAHTLNDNAETIIFNLCRGTGIKGLAGIPAVRENIVRPFLTSSREDVENYLNEKTQNFVTDSSNLTDDYTRNKIRHNVIPVLTEINSGFLSALSNMTDTLIEENEYLDFEAEKFIKSDLRLLHKAVRRRVIIKIFNSYNIQITSEMIKKIDELVFSEKLQKLNIKKNCFAVINGGNISVEFSYDNTDKKRIELGPVDIKIGQNRFFGDKIVIVFVNNGENINDICNVHDNLTNCIMDYDKIQGNIVLRNRRDGDGFIRCGRNFTSSLKKLFNAAILQNERDDIAILEDENGIIWVEKFGIADRVKITDKTVNVLSISVNTISNIQDI